MGNFRADVESGETFTPSRVEDMDKFEEVGECWIAEGFECEVKRLGPNILGIEESI